MSADIFVHRRLIEIRRDVSGHVDRTRIAAALDDLHDVAEMMWNKEAIESYEVENGRSSPLIYKWKAPLIDWTYNAPNAIAKLRAELEEVRDSLT